MPGWGFLTRRKNKVAPAAPGPNSKAKDHLSDPLSPDHMEGQQEPSTGKKISNWFGRTFKTKGWRKQEAERVVMSLGVEEMLQRYHDPFYAFAEKEYSVENVECYDAIKGGVQPESIYRYFIRPEGKMSVNISYKTRKQLMDLAAQDRYHEMNFDKVENELLGVMKDTLARAQVDPKFLATIARTF